jgi:hypothetical protein
MDDTIIIVIIYSIFRERVELEVANLFSWLHNNVVNG